MADRHGPSHGEVESDSSGPGRLEWTPEAEARMEKVPHGFMRTLTRQRVEAFARRHNVATITPALVDEKYAQWAAGSAKRKTSLGWEATALARLSRIPEFVRGMVIQEVERCAREMGMETVTSEAIERASGVWKLSGAFHSEANPDLYKRSQRRRKRGHDRN